MERRLRIGARVAVTRAEGPGARYALWLQGCSIRCAGCCNPHLFEAAGGELLAPSSLLREMAAAQGEIEGLTVLGGEPIDQADALAPLLHGARRLHLSVLLFSGFRLEELRSRPEPAVADVLRAVDVLVDGRYDASRPETLRLWVGSTNQRFHYLTARYSPAIEHPRHDEPLRTVEVRLGTDGNLSANGWPALSAGGMGASHTRTRSARRRR